MAVWMCVIYMYRRFQSAQAWACDYSQHGGHTRMTSTKYLEFWTPPPVCILARLIQGGPQTAVILTYGISRPYFNRYWNPLASWKTIWKGFFEVWDMGIDDQMPLIVWWSWDMLKISIFEGLPPLHEFRFSIAARCFLPKCRSGPSLGRIFSCTCTEHNSQCDIKIITG